MDKTSLGDRMKGYESVPSIKLMRRNPVIMRLDGKAFHTYTNRAVFKDEGAFSTVLRTIFREATQATIKQIQGARLAYMQSDEVSILITDWKNLNTDAWFKYGAQKMVSVASSIFTYYFNESALRHLHNGIPGSVVVPALFDARVFGMPFEEVNNYFVWRQQDATRNSIQMLGRSHFSHKQMDRKSTIEVKDMLINHADTNWNDIPTEFKRGSCVASGYNENDRLEFVYDSEVPIFSKHPNYVNSHLIFPK
jgi:tRNA(His) guanylyltransferase